MDRAIRAIPDRHGAPNASRMNDFDAGHVRRERSGQFRHMAGNAAHVRGKFSGNEQNPHIHGLW
jgi:hypothetical protein